MYLIKNCIPVPPTMDTKQLLDDDYGNDVPTTTHQNSDTPSVSVTQTQSTESGSDYPVITVGHLTSDPDQYLDLLTSAGSYHVTIKVYKQRWYILFVFALLALVQGGLCNIWTVIAESASAAFGWSDKMISLMQGWLFISFLITMIPASVFMDKKGVRPAMIASALCIALGAAMRCFSTTPPYVTWLANIGHILNGMAGPIMYTAGPVISALWFPLEQRATATAISTVAGFGGNAICFLIGPSFVEQPHANISTQGHNSSKEFTNMEVMRNEILYCRYGECCLTVLLLFCVILYFPSKPRMPPSLTAAIEKVDFTHGFYDLFRRKNANFWLVGLPYGFIISIYSVWTSLFDVNLQSLNVTEIEAGWLGFWAVSSGCVAAILVGRLADLVTGHMKPFILCMNVGFVLSTFGFLIIAEGYVPFSKTGLYVCAILQGIFCNGSIPLFYELSIEATYPVAEAATSAVLNILYNVIPMLFLFLFLLPKLGDHLAWMNWVMYASVLFSFPMLLGFKEKYRRLNIDRQAKMENQQSGILTDSEDNPNPTIQN